MKQLILILFILVAGCSHQHHHSHDHHGPSLNQGQKWTPDETLKSGMDNIHSGLVKLMKSESSRKASEKDYLAFYNEVQRNTENIIEKCKMPQEMDSSYHVVLEEMLDASEKLKDPATRQTVSRRFVKAFHQYQNYFEQEFDHD